MSKCVQKKLCSFSLIFLAYFLIIPSCGEKLNNINMDDNFTSGICGKNVISNFKNVEYSCRFKTEIQCRKETLAFLDKYPDIYCNFEEGSGRTKREIWINENAVLKLSRI